MRYTIAIDGPAASGKSTAAQKVSEELGYGRLDSGLLYRAITYILTRDGQALDLDAPPTKEKVEALVLTLKGGRLSYDGSDITDFLHTSAIDKVVGTVAKELYIREKTHRIQYEIINGPGEGIVVDGRDIGTVVIPDAFLKVFITAKDTTRAQRRLKDAGLPYDEVLRDIQERDYQDTHREHGPLKVADDAVVVENDEMTLKETVEHIVKLFKERKAKAAQ
ncbi:CMP/dCMP kinase [Pancytospora philotis]|nr:CMP/dCMP kinase [Pancytospora philotis]